MGSVTDASHWKQSKNDYLKFKRRSAPKRNPKEQNFRQRPTEQLAEERSARRHRVFSEERSVRVSSDEDVHRARPASVTPCGSTTVSESGFSEDLSAPVRTHTHALRTFASEENHDWRSSKHRPLKGNGRSSCIDAKWRSNAPAGTDDHDYRTDLRTRGQQVLLDMATLHSEETHGLTAQHEKLVRHTKRHPSSTSGTHVTTTSHKHPAHHHMRPGAPDFIPRNSTAVATYPRPSIPPPPSYPPSCGVTAASACPAPACPAPTYLPPQPPSSPVPYPPPASPDTVVPQAAPTRRYRSEPALSRTKPCQLPLQHGAMQEQQPQYAPVNQQRHCASMNANQQQELQQQQHGGPLSVNQQQQQEQQQQHASIPVHQHHHSASMTPNQHELQQPEAYGVSLSGNQQLQQHLDAPMIANQQQQEQQQLQPLQQPLQQQLRQQLEEHLRQRQQGGPSIPTNHQQYGPSMSANLQQEYGVSMPMNEYGVTSPEQQNSASMSMNQYGAISPEQQYSASMPINQYGAISPEQQYSASMPINQYGAISPEQQYCASMPINQYGAISPEQQYSASMPMNQYGVISPEQQYGASMPMNQYGAIPPEQQYGASMPMNQYGAISMPTCSYGAMSSDLSGSSLSPDGQSVTTMLLSQQYIPTNQFVFDQISTYDCASYKRRPEPCADVQMTDVPMDFDFLD